MFKRLGFSQNDINSDLSNTQYILDILKYYKNDFDIKDLELCLKIDKTIEFITLSTKDKKEINNLILL
jgi:hypothetical protein